MSKKKRRANRRSDDHTLPRHRDRHSDSARSFGLPTKTIGWTVLAVAGCLGLRYGSEWLNESINLDPGVPNLLILLLIALTTLLWLIWIVFFSGYLWKTRIGVTGLILIAIASFFVLFDVRNTGAVGISRWQPRFWSFKPAPAEIGAPAIVDLSVESPGDFRQFLGNDRNGVVNNVVLSSQWQGSYAPRLIWKQSIGEGWSGFAAANLYAVTQEQRGPDQCVTCYDILSGRLQWIHKRAGRHRDAMSLGHAGPRATPTIDQGKVYAQGATGVLECLDGSTGDLIWDVDLPKVLGIEMIPASSLLDQESYEYEDSNLAWGRACSPLIVDNKVIVTGGGPLGGPFVTLMAFDKDTGEPIWRGGDEMIAYGSPALVTLLGRPQITLVAESKAMGFDPENGEVLWTHDRPGTSNEDANCSQVTYVNDNQLLLSKGYSLGGELIKLSENEGKYKTESLWVGPRVLKTKLTNPVIKDGFAYSLSDGFLECTEVASGRRRWKKRGRFGDGQILLVSDKLLIHSENGSLHLVDTNPETYDEFGQIKTIDGVCWNTLCFFNHYLLVRSEIEAACYELVVDTGESAEEKKLKDIPFDEVIIDLPEERRRK